MSYSEMKEGCGRRDFLAFTALGAATLPITSCASSVSAAGRSKGSWIPSQKFLDDLPVIMRCASLPGLSMAVVDGGKISWTRVFGVANAETKEPVHENTLFEAASMSKPAFAYGVLRLVDEGRIDLNRPLASYYKPPYLPDHPRINKITAFHALTHSTGLPNWGDSLSSETLIPAFEPGQHYSYSGEGFLWLQYVVEHLTGTGIDAFMREYLFEPAGMNNSMYAYGDEEFGRVAAGHRHGRIPEDRGFHDSAVRFSPVARKWRKPIRDWTLQDLLRAEKELDPNSDRVRVVFHNAASSLMTTATDYAKFLTHVMDHENRESWEISDELRRSMIEPKIAIQEGVPLWWGLGWGLENPEEGWRFTREGNNANRFTSYAGADPRMGNGLVVLTNDGSGFGVYQRLVRDATGYDQLTFISDNSPPHEG